MTTSSENFQDGSSLCSLGNSNLKHTSSWQTSKTVTSHFSQEIPTKIIILNQYFIKVDPCRCTSIFWKWSILCYAIFSMVCKALNKEYLGLFALLGVIHITCIHKCVSNLLIHRMDWKTYIFNCIKFVRTFRHIHVAAFWQFW